jgi:hypothetical protein
MSVRRGGSFMRAAKMFTVSIAAAATVALLGCGSTTSESPAGTTDSGAVTDGTAPISDSSLTDSPSDATQADAGVVSDGACVFSDADLNTATPTDAALNDSGASVGTCLACAQTNCQSDVTACNADACCESAFSCVFNCLSGVGSSLIYCYIDVCGGSLSTSSADAVETKLGECAFKSCATECAVCSYDSNLCKDSGAPPIDAGMDAGSDASDAAGD